jgi:hypothetical protein
MGPKEFDRRMNQLIFFDPPVESWESCNKLQFESFSAPSPIFNGVFLRKILLRRLGKLIFVSELGMNPTVKAITG